jgi:lysophospholipase L1-like esterase
MKYIIFSVIIILLFGTLLKKEVTIQKLLPENTILAFGDSLTYGYGATPQESYPSVLSSLSGIKVLNAGINGETSEDGLKRLPSILKDPSIKLMILCFGGNDILQKRSMQDLKQNLKKMVKIAKEKHIDILLLSVPDMNLFGLSPLPLYQEIAKEENIGLAEGILSDILSTPSLKSDQIHPNAAGYKEMAYQIYTTLKSYGWIQ